MRGIDRINSLPDCLIHHILSFLKTKESVRTSIVSKKWIHVWKSVPRLDLDLEDFTKGEDFDTFANSILHYKLFSDPQQLDTFNLRRFDWNEGSYETIKTWLSNLVSFKPKVVNIRLSNLDEVDLISVWYLFNCTKLESLVLSPRLHGARVNKMVENLKVVDVNVINFPCLRRLNLAWFKLNDEFIQKLVLGCPVLEELGFEYCYFDFTEKLTFSTVKKLVICDCKFSENSMLGIHMPSLEYLSCEVRLGRVLFENLPSLKHASIIVRGFQKKSDEKERRSPLRGLSNAKTLRLSGPAINVETSDLPVFEKLESLDLDNLVIDKDLEPLASFLRRTPNLKTLIWRKIKMMEGKRFLGGLCGRFEIHWHTRLKTVNEFVKYLLYFFHDSIDILSRSLKK